MAVHLKLLRNEIPSSKNYGKWVALPQSQGEVDTEELARRINHGSTFRESEVYGIIRELVTEMRKALHEGCTVVLDGFGRFHLAVESEAVDSPEEFNIQQHVRRSRCKFVEAGRRRLDNTLERPLSSGVRYTMQPEYDVDEEQGATFRRRGKQR